MQRCRPRLRARAGSRPLDGSTAKHSRKTDYIKGLGKRRFGWRQGLAYVAREKGSEAGLRWSDGFVARIPESLRGRAPSSDDL